jgi:acetoacetyl-CoA synthetase
MSDALPSLNSSALSPDAPALLWAPSEQQNRNTAFAAYLDWLRRERGLDFSGYRETWEWSSTEIEAFWSSIWDFFQILSSHPPDTILVERKMPGAQWFPGVELSYAEHIFRNRSDDRPALLFQSERHPLREVSWAELSAQVASVAAGLREMGVEKGDRVVAYLPNIPEAVVAFLASASLGAIYSSCSPDFGTQSVVERFRQIEPKVLFAVDGYSYGGKSHDRLEVLAELQRSLPSLQHTVLVPYLDRASHADGTRRWDELLGRDAELVFERVPFDHPLWILYSSGTTGAPKAIVHGHGGIVLEHLKALVIQADVKPADRFFWFTTTGWMMWNLLVSGLLTGCSIVLYDGSPAHPDQEVLWKLAERARVTRFGGSPTFYANSMKAGLIPGKHFDLSSLRTIGATGSPLPSEGFRWIYSAVKDDIWLTSSSGGTDVATAFVGGCPTLPLYEGELQGPALGVRVQAFDPEGRPVVEEVGELVVTEPMPSMPLFFWNDPDGSRYHESYFDMYPGIWRHGDWIRFSSRGTSVIYGRSDSTLNRQGVRIGTAEIYRAVESVPGVVDSLVIGVEQPGGGYYMPLFVVLEEGRELDVSMEDAIRQQIRTMFTARHVPDEIVEAPAIPRTLSGKKLEVPIKKILLGSAPEKVANIGSLANPESLRFFVEFARRRAAGS